MPEYLVDIASSINNLPLLLRLFIIALTAAIEYVVPIFPGDTIILLAGFLSTQGGLGLLEISLAALIGGVFGSYLGYAIGRAINKGQLAQHWVEKFASAESLERWKHWFWRWGYFLIIINRFFTGLRAFFFVAAGLYKLPLGPVLLCGAISSAIFNILLFGLGYFLGNNMSLIFYILKTYSFFVYFIIILIAIIFIIGYVRRSK